MRVTDAQARILAAYDGTSKTVWYRVPECDAKWPGEMEALRDVAADLLDARAMLATVTAEAAALAVTVARYGQWATAEWDPSTTGERDARRKEVLESDRVGAEWMGRAHAAEWANEALLPMPLYGVL